MEEKVVENCKVVDENVSSSRCSSMGELDIIRSSNKFVEVLHIIQTGPGTELEILVWGGQVVMLVYYLRQTSTHI